MKKLRLVVLVAALMIGAAAVGQKFAEKRFSVFYRQSVDSLYDADVMHDALTGQEVVCVRFIATRSASCYLTGRVWK